MPVINKEQMMKKQKKEKHVCIRIFKDDSVQITDQDGNPLETVNDPKPLAGPEKTYHQALWFNHNPTCVWHGGRLYCG